MEMWDLVDKYRQPLNKIHNREDEIVVGEYHAVVDIWTVNNNKEILVTLRDPNKDKYPNLWENTCGSVLSGESSIEGAKRELFEETGISVKEDDLYFLGTKQEKTAFVDSYIIRKNIGISELTMQEGETVSAKWITLEELDEMIKRGEVALPVSKRLDFFRKEFEKFLLEEDNDWE